MKVTIIGANGAIGQNLTRLLLSGIIPDLTDLNLIVKSSKSRNQLEALAEDSLTSLRKITVKVSQDHASLEGSDVVVFCAGVAASQNLSRDVVRQNNRQSLFEKNLQVVLEYLNSINNYCSPSTLMLMVSNPVGKLIQSIVKDIKCSVVGVGVANDTLRLRNHLYKRFGCKNAELIPFIDSVFVVGDHSNPDYLGVAFIEKNAKTEQIYTALFDGIRKFPQLSSYSHMKERQENILHDVWNGKMTFKNGIAELSQLPPFYSTLLIHRSVHFAIKTYYSTSLAILDVLQHFSGIRHGYICAETVAVDGQGHKGIVGVPVFFENREVKVADNENIWYPSFESEIIDKCIKMYSC